MTTNNFDCYLKLLSQEIVRWKALGGRSLSSLIETFFKLKIDQLQVFISGIDKYIEQ